MNTEKLSVICLSSSLRQKLLDFQKSSNDEKPQSGFVFGWHGDGEAACIGCAYEPSQIPAGLASIGAFCYLSNPNSTDQDAIDLCDSILKAQWEKSNDKLLDIVLIVRGDKDEASVNAVTYSVDYGVINNPAIEIRDDNDLISCCVLLRAKGFLPLSFDASPNNEDFQTNLNKAVDKYKHFADIGKIAFHLKNSAVLLMKGDESNSVISDLVKISESETEDQKPKSKRKKFELKDREPVNFELVFKTTNIAVDESEKHTPIIEYQRNNFTSIKIPIAIDLIGLARYDDPISTAYQALVDAFILQIRAFADSILMFKKGMKVLSCETFHFWPPQCAHPVTAIYPTSLDDKELLNYRRSLHHNLLLPTDHPLLRKLNKFEFRNELNKNGYLRNTHVGLSTCNEPNSQIAVVSGTYTYHHYMQDRIDDNGWGCAYRSLQTIVSWFRHQGYTDKHVPSHKEIQQTLVDVGDKVKGFVGSRQWIGSQEVNFVLSEWLGVTSKIMFVSSGTELASKGRELLHHFQTQGTPIMIGGGVLAHTILGVEYNELSGNIRFLILDPHYTGAEDLTVIQNKGWCGWKNSDFWDKTAFYNLCLPQRPIEF